MKQQQQQQQQHRHPQSSQQSATQRSQPGSSHRPIRAHSAAALPPQGFVQDPPQLGNAFEADRPLRQLLARRMPPDVRAAVEPSLRHMGEISGGRLWELAARHRLDEPRHTPWDAWGRRIDDVRVAPSWDEYARVAAREGLVALGYERRHGPYSRLHQFALVHLFDPSSQVYTCPLAMTDGCARTLETMATPALRDAVLLRLIAREPERAWTSGQWMTERIGGSDVGQSETLAVPDVGGSAPGALGASGGNDRWRLYGDKYFTSAITANVALTLGRPEGAVAGGKGLALFFVQARDGLTGRLDNSITVHRLKDKLGTRLLPTAELSLHGTPAVAVCGATDGVKNISTMLNMTRTWNAVCAVAKMARGLAIARDFARRRVAFGGPLSENLLHLETLAGIAAEYEAALQLAFYGVHWLGHSETGDTSDETAALLRLALPIAKLCTARQAVDAVSEIIECLGGNGYMEDTGLPELLRDTHVLTIWEGTTNVLSMEALRSIRKTPALPVWIKQIKQAARAVREPALVQLAQHAATTTLKAAAWLDETAADDAAGSQTVTQGARGVCLTLGRAMALALLCEQAQWALDNESDPRTAAAAHRFARHGIDCLLPRRPSGAGGDTAAAAAAAATALAMG